MNPLVALVVLAAAGLAGIVGAELWPSAAETERAPVASAIAAPTAGAANVPAVAPPAGAVNEILLARPLFSQTRRPPDGAGPTSAVTGSAEPLPRMTAILIDGPNRRAIFASGQGKAVTVVEGGRLGAFTVQSIEPRQVTLIGPAGPQTVRTTFDPSLAAPAQAPIAGFVPPQFPGIQLPGSVAGGRLLGGAVLSPGVVPNPFNTQPAPPSFDAGAGSSAGAAR